MLVRMLDRGDLRRGKQFGSCSRFRNLKSREKGQKTFGVGTKQSHSLVDKEAAGGEMAPSSTICASTYLD